MGPSWLHHMVLEDKSATKGIVLMTPPGLQGHSAASQFWRSKRLCTRNRAQVSVFIVPIITTVAKHLWVVGLAPTWCAEYGITVRIWNPWARAGSEWIQRGKPRNAHCPYTARSRFMTITISDSKTTTECCIKFCQQQTQWLLYQK